MSGTPRARRRNNQHGEFLLEREFEVGPQRVRIRFAGPALIDVLTPALDHLSASRPASEAARTLHVYVFESKSTATPMPPPPWGPDCYGARGEIAGFNTSRFRTVYQPGMDILHILDRQRAAAIYWVCERDLIPYWERSFPLRTVLHWWMIGQPYQLLHAAAVGSGEGGVLITGPSGSGKSTTALACLEGGMSYAGDDYVLAGLDPPWVSSLYGTAKLAPDNVHRFPDLARWITNPDRLGSEKALLFLKCARPRQLSRGFAIRAVLTPRVTGRKETRLVPVSPMVSLQALAPTTVLHLPGGGADMLEKMSRLVKAVPNYVLEAGTDLSRIPEVIGTLLRGASA